MAIVSVLASFGCLVFFSFFMRFNAGHRLQAGPAHRAAEVRVGAAEEEQLLQEGQKEI